jgi:hypothetical protein
MPALLPREDVRRSEHCQGATTHAGRSIKRGPRLRPADQPQFQTAPIGVRVQHGPKLPPL